MRMRVACVCICLLLVGCSAYSPSPATPALNTSTETLPSSPDPQTGSVTVTGERLPIDPNQTFERVKRLTAAEIPSPQVHVRKLDTSAEPQSVSASQFDELMGITTTSWTAVSGGVASGRSIQLWYTDTATPADLEQTLAHEFAHTAQPSDLREQLDERVAAERQTTDGRMVRTAIFEGSATYIADLYTARYLDIENQSTQYRTAWPNWTTGTRYKQAPYLFGATYFRDRRIEPDELPHVYQNPPSTTAQLLHGDIDSDGEGLSVDSQTTGWDPTLQDRKGELYLRIILADLLSDNRAAQTATGWVDDQQITYYNGSDVGHAWVIRWIDATNASQFDATIIDYLDHRADRRNGLWVDGETHFRYSRINENTTVLFAGDPAFVSTATITVNESTPIVKTEGDPYSDLNDKTRKLERRG